MTPENRLPNISEQSFQEVSKEAAFKRLLKRIGLAKRAIRNAVPVFSEDYVECWGEPFVSDEDYKRATISLPFGDLVLLDREQTIALQTRLANIVKKNCRQKDIGPDEMEVSPGNPQNTLEHEIQHFNALPQTFRQEGVILLTFTYNEEKRLSLEGLTYYHSNSELSDEEAFRSFVAPTHMSTSDLEKALTIAAGIKNDDLREKLFDELGLEKAPLLSENQDEDWEILDEIDGEGDEDLDRFI